MDWNHIIHRMRSGEPLEDILDEAHAIDRERFRSSIADMGERGIEALRGYDIAMRDLDMGITGARNAWHSISAAQRLVLTVMVETKKARIIRRSVKPSEYWLPDTSTFLCRVKTIRNLCSRDLLAWDGGAFDPEEAAVLTERGQFVVRHGAPT